MSQNLTDRMDSMSILNPKGICSTQERALKRIFLRDQRCTKGPLPIFSLEGKEVETIRAHQET